MVYSMQKNDVLKGGGFYEAHFIWATDPPFYSHLTRAQLLAKLALKGVAATFIETTSGNCGGVFFVSGLGTADIAAGRVYAAFMSCGASRGLISSAHNTEWLGASKDELIAATTYDLFDVAEVETETTTGGLLTSKNLLIGAAVLAGLLLLKG